MKNINFDKLEILSPAGNSESFLAAINNGADAIYLGLDSFNARMKAQNFSKENIREHIKLAHSFGVKVYITINTLLKDEDFDELISLVNFLISAKADAFIVQDLGVAYILKKCFKNINLHASTQMGIHNLEGALVAEKLGFSRIVLSRETTLADIEEIHKNTNLEIEYFVQGALCVAFSGNCYLSSLENNASGNEGKCLQLCRLPYKNNQTNEIKYYLSPRDLSLIEKLPKLIDAGVTSFKIEGRMKHSGYVGICTNLYKTALNLIKNNNFNNKFLSNANNILQKTFSRGEFNKNAYLFINNENNIINSTFQNHIGIKIGKVESVKNFKDNLYKIIIFSSHKISDGDGLKFIDSKNNQVASIGVGNPILISDNKYQIITKQKLEKDINVYLIQDSVIEEKFLNNKRKIQIKLKISAQKCKKLLVKIIGQNVNFEYNSEEILQPASSQPLSENDFISQFSKIKDSIFEITDIQIDTNGVFAPKSLLNKIRREAFCALQEYLIYLNEEKQNILFLPEEYQKQKTQNISISPQNLIITDEFQPNLNSDIIQILSPNEYNKNNLIKNFENIIQKNYALMLPVINNFEDKKIINDIILSLPNNIPLFVNNISGLYYKIFNNKEVIVSPLLNIKNKFSILALNELKVNKICASVESSQEFATKNNLTFFESGNFPIMTFAHCPYKAVHENNCNMCKFNNNLRYQSQSQQEYKISRIKISNCQFYLMKNLSCKKPKYSLKNLKVI